MRAFDMAALSKNGERDHLGARFTSKLSNANGTIVGALECVLWKGYRWRRLNSLCTLHALGLSYTGFPDVLLPQIAKTVK